MMPITKLAAARHQLGTATALFLKDMDPISVQCLACGAGELLDALAEEGGAPPFRALILETHPNLDIVKVKRLRNQFWNAFKHLSDRSGTPRDDQGLLAVFSDEQNDAALFIAWHDYNAITGNLPIAAQVLQVWYQALNEDKLHPGEDLELMRWAFPGVADLPRSEQKRMLRETVERYERSDDLLADEKTEPMPLIVMGA
jgi:hypothetical protein